MPGAQVQRREALEEMHREMAQLLASGARIHTFFDLKCQQLRQYYDEERLSSKGFKGDLSGVVSKRSCTG